MLVITERSMVAGLSTAENHSIIPAYLEYGRHVPVSYSTLVTLRNNRDKRHRNTCLTSNTMAQEWVLSNTTPVKYVPREPNSAAPAEVRP